MLIEEIAYRNRKYVFEDRLSAGLELAKKLEGLVERDAIVLSIPAGGVPVGYMVAKKLRLPFDVIVVRKLHIPWNPEAGFGAVTWDGMVVFNEPLLSRLRLSKAEVERCVNEERRAVERRVELFRGNKPFPKLEDRTVLLVDDGLASGYSMLAAARSVKKREPREVIVAVPTASLGAIELVKNLADKVVCLNVRSGLPYAVADAYVRWYDLSEEEVLDFLR
jgi:predicted phosphoribosyltransferase